MIFNDSSSKADARLEDVIEAIEKKDTGAIKELFSKKALDEAEDFYAKADILFNIFQDGVELWSFGSGQVNTHYYYGTEETNARHTYIITSGGNEYMFFLYEITANTENPDEVGLYMLQVFTPEEEERATQFDWGDGKLYPGIWLSDELLKDAGTGNEG